MKYHRTPDEEQLFRFNLFCSILDEVSAELKDGSSDQPQYRSPSTLVDYILDELVGQHPFISRANISYVSEECGILLSEDPIIAADLKLTSAFRALSTAIVALTGMNRMMRPNRAASVLGPPLSVVEGMLDSGAYFDALIDRLIHQVCHAPIHAVSYDDLLWSTRALAFQFLGAGFSISWIGWLTNHLTWHHIADDGAPLTHLPLKVPKRDFLSETRFDAKSYNEASLSYLESYNIERRLRALSDWYRDAENKYTAVCRLKGFRGHKDLKVGDVLIYPVFVGQRRIVYCHSPISADVEAFGEAGGVNAAVDVSARDADAALARAHEEIAKSLDILGSIVRTRIPLEIDVGRNLITDRRGHLLAERLRTLDTDPKLAKHYAIDTDQPVEAVDAINTSLARIMAAGDPRDADRLTNSVRSLRRANEAPLLEDQLLQGWMALESLLGDDSGVTVSNGGVAYTTAEAKIEATAAAIAMNHFRWQMAIETYGSVAHAVEQQTFNGHTNLVRAPAQVMREARLVQHGPELMTAGDLYRYVCIVRPFVAEPVLRGKVELMIRFYSDPSFAASVLVALRRDVFGELVVIYQLRNRLVHQARRRLEVLEYYADRCRGYAIRTLMLLLGSSPADSHTSTFQNQIDTANALISSLRSGNASALLAL